MAKLVDLPNELLLDVAAYLVGDATTLANLSAQPWLHSSVRIPLPADTEATPLEPLRLSLRTIPWRPDLAKHVKDVSLIEAPQTQEMAEYPDTGYLQKINPNTRRANHQFNSLVIEVFSLLPNAEHLSFTARSKHPKELPQQLYHRMRTDSLFLSKPRSVHLQKEYEKGPVNIRDYIPFLDSPSFEELTTKNDVDAVLGGFPPKNILKRSTSQFYWTVLSSKSQHLGYPTP